jgi:hypothetical protein
MSTGPAGRGWPGTLPSTWLRSSWSLSEWLCLLVEWVEAVVDAFKK